MSSAYLSKVREILAHLEETQGAPISAAADVIIEALRHGGVVHCAEIGHGIQMDFINRAGGLCVVQPFTWSIAVHQPVPECRRRALAAENADRDLAQIRLAVSHSDLRAGDVMLLGSVSGRNRGPVELALACRARGVKVIGFTSLTYTAGVESLHPSGKRLFEVVDVAVDNGAPYGDAGVDVPGYDVKLIPLSGLGMLVSGWLIWEQVLIRMAAAGNAPSILISHNREDGPAFNEKSRAQYNQRGF